MGNRKKFVTGATGYVGQRLVQALAKEGFTVYALSRKETDFFADLPNVHVIIGDITDEVRLPSGIETIYHCAGVIRNEEEMEQVNVQGTKYMVDLALTHDCMLVYLSSAGIVGKTDVLIIDEHTPCHPHNAYEISKYKAEQIVNDAAKKGLRTQSLRPTTVIGPNLNPKNNGFLQLARSMRGGMYRQIGDGIYNSIHIDEVVRALVMLDDKDLQNGGVYIINDPIPYKTMNVIVKALPPAVVSKTRSLPKIVACGAVIMLSFFYFLIGKPNPFRMARLKALVRPSMYSQKRLESIGFALHKDVAQHITETCEGYIREGILS